jgi:hypothetical protein
VYAFTFQFVSSITSSVLKHLFSATIKTNKIIFMHQPQARLLEVVQVKFTAAIVVNVNTVCINFTYILISFLGFCLIYYFLLCVINSYEIALKRFLNT